MNEHNKDPRCPYCGSKMNENLLSYSNGGGWCNFECPNCGATSPKKENSESCNKAELAAYFAAKKRYEEPNRVLTLDELKTYIGYAWYEGDHKWYHSSFDYPVWIEDGKYNYEGDLYDIPDVEGRFWLRKPTKAELDAKREDEGR